MVSIKSAKKRTIQSEKRRQYNASNRSMMRTLLRKVHTAIALKDNEAAQNAFYVMQKIIDRKASNGLLHKNKASRYKSIINAKINTLLQNSNNKNNNNN
ncbi:30S ribosomal protein S20 [secondary endosymbiont of Trabutina mannipara]|uniref:30S ribosomal protein S20 n=1 Tax=secondary endosymbiont of Trabutina mannipara TaxID=1835721 RepID=UPI0009F34664|nr:30S ribosomal protein S20 [secondary endosymbiont of Trabutina mannipara]